jgi:predicted amidohydrolase YtcJ
MDPEVRDAYLKQRQQIDSSGTGFVSQQAFKNAMAFDRAFVAAGGLLAAGVDPTGIGGALAGFGDQRNYELFIEAGFTPAQAVQIMTLNGAKILGVQQTLGSVETGKLADLVVLKGDLTADPSVIRSPTIVFKDGVGYDSAKLIASVQGRVGVN